jgi:hypothetical protein
LTGIKKETINQIMNNKYPHRVRPNNSLPINTRVYVDGRGAGIVARVESARDQFGGAINVHHIQFPDGKITGTNYSFISFGEISFDKR